MNLETYKEKIKELEDELSNRKNILTRDYVFSNNPYKVGDIVSDAMGKIRIENIKYSYGIYSSDNPCAVYYGIVINKNGSESKRKEIRKIYQHNVIEP